MGTSLEDNNFSELVTASAAGIADSFIDSMGTWLLGINGSPDGGVGKGDIKYTVGGISGALGESNKVNKIRFIVNNALISNHIGKAGENLLGE